MENLDEFVRQKQVISSEESTTNLNSRYETVCNVLFRKLGIKPNQQLLIRAFIEAAQGEKQFEISYLELADILFEKGSAAKDALRKRVENWLKVLMKWQESNCVELIRILESGSKKENKVGRFDYHKSKYELVMLDGFQKLIDSSSENLDADIEAFILSLNAQFQPIKKARKYHPRHQAKKNKKDILTKLKRTFELVAEANDNPVKYCQLVLDEACKTLNEIEAKWTEQRTRENIISEFESYLNNSEASDGIDSGLES